MIKPGTLVQIIKSKDQPPWLKTFWGQYGVVVQRTYMETYGNYGFYKVLMGTGKIEIFHYFDLAIIKIKH